ncbi:MAG: DUF2958 domain-containing protein [bacterium]|nr:DUF2958 domain-containing protein [bacterium]
MTKALETRFKKTGSQENIADPVVIGKWFNPYGRNTWFATEYDPETRTCFGFVVGPFDDSCDEWGYFSLDEIESVRVGRFGLPLERDLYFTAEPISKVHAAALTKLGR